MRSATFFHAAAAMLMASTAHASTLAIPDGAVAECAPFPSVKAIKSGEVFFGEEPSSVLITCHVIEGQPIQAQSKIIGEIRAVSALGPYSILFQRLQLPTDEGGLVWNPDDSDSITARIQENGNLRVTFGRGITANLDSDPASAGPQKKAGQ